MLRARRSASNGRVFCLFQKQLAGGCSFFRTSVAVEFCGESNACSHHFSSEPCSLTTFPSLPVSLSLKRAPLAFYKYDDCAFRKALADCLVHFHLGPSAAEFDRSATAIWKCMVCSSADPGIGSMNLFVRQPS